MAKREALAKKVDGSKLHEIQVGCVGDPPPAKEEPEPEDLSPREEIEKGVMQRIIKQLVPEFPVKKLKKMTYVETSRFFDGPCEPLLQEEILHRYKDISP